MKYAQDNKPNRHKLIREISLESAPTTVSIKDIEELQASLQKAIAVELFTIPPYLCALYSIKDGSNEVAAHIIRSVAMEEMLHLVLVANILNAIGGKPIIFDKGKIPQYPGPVPESAAAFEVSLLKFSKEAINTFLRIEKPSVEGAIPEIDKFNSIGQFYAAVRKAIIRLNEEARAQGEARGIFIGDSNKQVGPEHYYGSGGKIVKVTNLEHALLAIDEIVGQGEGIDSSINDTDDSMFDDDVEFAHYFRFNEIFQERYYKVGDKPHDNPSGDPLHIDWNDVYNMEPNPKVEKYTDPWLKEKAIAFNQTYSDLLKNIEYACNGSPSELAKGIPLMFKLKNQAVELMKIPSGNGNYTAGPSFELV